MRAFKRGDYVIRDEGLCSLNPGEVYLVKEVRTFDDGWDFTILTCEPLGLKPLQTYGTNRIDSRKVRHATTGELFVHQL